MFGYYPNAMNKEKPGIGSAEYAMNKEKPGIGSAEYAMNKEKARHWKCRVRNEQRKSPALEVPSTQ